ncbi:MAG: hypothetical protein ACP5PQ_06630 [Thermoproteota archaeon]
MVTTINVRVTEEEKDVATKLARYLYLHRKIQEPTLSEAIRASLHFTVNEIIKAIEAERYAK